MIHCHVGCHGVFDILSPISHMLFPLIERRGFKWSGDHSSIPAFECLLHLHYCNNDVINCSSSITNLEYHHHNNCLYKKSTLWCPDTFSYNEKKSHTKTPQPMITHHKKRTTPIKECLLFCYSTRHRAKRPPSPSS